MQVWLSHWSIKYVMFSNTCSQTLTFKISTWNKCLVKQARHFSVCTLCLFVGVEYGWSWECCTGRGRIGVVVGVMGRNKSSDHRHFYEKTKKTQLNQTYFLFRFWSPLKSNEGRYIVLVWIIHYLIVLLLIRPCPGHNFVLFSNKVLWYLDCECISMWLGVRYQHDHIWPWLLTSR